MICFEKQLWAAQTNAVSMKSILTVFIWNWCVCECDGGGEGCGDVHSILFVEVGRVGSNYFTIFPLTSSAHSPCCGAGEKHRLQQINGIRGRSQTAVMGFKQLELPTESRVPTQMPELVYLVRKWKSNMMFQLISRMMNTVLSWQCGRCHQSGWNEGATRGLFVFSVSY